MENRQEQRIWAEHQQMQLTFLQRHGLTSSSTVLDIGCGPMDSSVLIPLLKDWYYGQDINPATIALVKRSSVSPVFMKRLLAPCCFDQFDLGPVDRKVRYLRKFIVQPPHVEFDLRL